jgi:hypothetical protein
MNVKRFFRQYAAEIFLFGTTLFIRFPFFFRDYIDKDESTFILMGQSIADGYLPYDRLWDLKPPLLFYFFALIERVFPHSFVALRFCGVLIVFISAVLLMIIAWQARLKNGFLIALGYVVLASEFGSLQGVMSEHLAVFFMLLGLVVFMRDQKRSIDFFLCGVFFGCAVLCKLNYAYAVAALSVFFLINGYRNNDVKHKVFNLLQIGVGILLPVSLMAIPFIFSQKTDLFVNSVFLAPLKYARALNFSFIDKLKTSWWVFALTGLLIYVALKRSKEENRWIVFMCSAILAGTVYTFFSSGIVNGHYLVQIYPFILLLVFGVIVQKLIQLKFGWAALVVILVSGESILEYARLIKATKNPPEYRATFEVLDVLKQRGLDKSKIFFADYHIGYWLLHKYPLTKSTTHPSNLARPYLFPYYNEPVKTSLEEMSHIFDGIRPDVIVSETDGLKFFPEGTSENAYFKNIISRDFQMIYKDSRDRIYIWERVIR